MTLKCVAILLAFALLPALAFAQHDDLGDMSDQAFLTNLRALRQSGVPGQTAQNIREPGECLFHVSLEITRRMTTMNASDREELRRLLLPLQTQSSIVSPSGRFRIHFDSTGANAPAMLDPAGSRIPGTAMVYAVAVAAAFDTVYEAEVTRAVYLPPPFETGQSSYNIYIREMGSDYGWTVPISQLPSSTLQPVYTTYIEIDNDFAGNYYTRGLDGARVTAAHEFHHMIQLGVYGAWYSDRWFHELTSTYYEDYVFDEVNDYFQYLRTENNNNSVFNHPDRPLYAWMDWGYPLAIFAKMLEKRHPDAALRRTWEEMKRREPISALDEALRASATSSDLSTEMCMFARWNYATGPRYWSAPDTAERYGDGTAYPGVRFASTTEAISGSASFNSAVAPLGTVYMRAYSGVDTVAFSVTNFDVQAARNRSVSAVAFQLEVRKDAAPSDYVSIGNGWHYRFTASANGVLCLNTFAKDAVPEMKAAVYPNPFDPSSDLHVRFSVPHDILQTRAALTVFSSSMDLIARIDDADVRSDSMYGRHIVWNGKTNAGDFAGSGVYLYFVTIGSRTLSGKFAVIRR